VEDILREVAKLFDFEVQQVFQDIAMLSQVSTPVLTSTASLLTDIFENSRDVSNKDLITPPRRSSKLVKTPAAKGTWRLARKKQKAIVESSTDRGSYGDSESEYCNSNKLNEEANSSDDNRGSEGGA
jgi:hypothetical protein